jgi:tungstate transport system permease protein
MDYFLEALRHALALIVGFDAEVYLIVWTSLAISLAAVLLAALAAVPLGIVTALRSFTGKRMLLHALNALMAVPTVVVGLVLYGVLGRQGPLGELGLLYTPAAIVIGQCLLIIPIIWNLSIAAIDGTDPRLASTCRAIGASASQQLVIFVTEARYALTAAVVMGFGRAIGEVGVAMMLGGNIEGYTRTMTTAIALETSKGEFELAMALGLLLLACAFLVTATLQCLQESSSK